MKLDVVSPNENYKGMSYGQWAAIWANWLMCKDPDYYNGDDILFLRGNVNYGPVGNIEGSPRFIDPKGVYKRLGKEGVTIFEQTAILIPIVTVEYWIGGMFD